MVFSCVGSVCYYSSCLSLQILSHVSGSYYVVGMYVACQLVFLAWDDHLLSEVPLPPLMVTVDLFLSWVVFPEKTSSLPAGLVLWEPIKGRALELSTHADLPAVLFLSCTFSQPLPPHVRILSGLPFAESRPAFSCCSGQGQLAGLTAKEGYGDLLLKTTCKQSSCFQCHLYPVPSL